MNVKMSDEASEGELALRKRRDQNEESHSTGLDEADQELLEQNEIERGQLEEEIDQLKERSERRKKEREQEDKRLAAERAAEDARRKGEEEERKRKKEEEEQKRLHARQQKAAEREKWKQPPKANFVISKREQGGEEEGEAEAEGAGKKSKEQLEAEKRAILAQRIKPLEIDGFDSGRLVDKIKELHSLIHRLEGEKYDLEHRYKVTQVQLTELADRARQATKAGDVKRIHAGTDDAVDRIQTRFAGAPSKVEMYSKYERQKDKRTYVERHVLYTGPQYALPTERIPATRIVNWNDEGLPIYAGGEGGGHHE